MNAQELLDEWESGETGFRPKRVQSLRDELQEYTGQPVPRRLPEIESWLPRMQGTITAKLRKAADEEGPPIEDDEE
jgi:hypothetical protein